MTSTEIVLRKMLTEQLKGLLTSKDIAGDIKKLPDILTDKITEICDDSENSPKMASGNPKEEQKDMANIVTSLLQKVLDSTYDHELRSKIENIILEFNDLGETSIIKNSELTRNNSDFVVNSILVRI